MEWSQEPADAFTGEMGSSLVNTVDTRTIELIFKHAGQVCVDYMSLPVLFFSSSRLLFHVLYYNIIFHALISDY